MYTAGPEHTKVFQTPGSIQKCIIHSPDEADVKVGNRGLAAHSQTLDRRAAGLRGGVGREEGLLKALASARAPLIPLALPRGPPFPRARSAALACAGAPAFACSGTGAGA